MIRSLIISAAVLIAVVGLSSCSFIMNLRKAPLEGTVRIYDDKRNLEKTLHYENGLLNGLCEGYYPSGAVEWQSHFSDGRKNGIQRTYFENGRLRSETPFIKGHIHGIVTVYDEAGHLVMEIPVKNDRVSGEVIRYRYDDAPNSYQEPCRRKSPRADLDSSDDLDMDRLRQLALARKMRLQMSQSEKSPDERLVQVDDGTIDDNSVDEDSTAFSETKSDDAQPKVAEQPAPAGASPTGFWDEFTAITGKMTRKAAPVETASASENVRTRLRGDDVATSSQVRSAADNAVRYKVGVAVDDVSTEPVEKSAPVTTSTRSTAIQGVSARDAARNLPTEGNRVGASVTGTTPVNAKRATESQIVRDYLKDSASDDPDALARERVIAQMDKKKSATQTLRTTASGMEILYRQTPSGNEYLVYPKGGSASSESWRYQMLKAGYDPNDAVRRGL